MGRRIQQFFRQGGRFDTIFGTVADLIVLNALTLLCSLPVLTAGAALTAMYAGVFRLREGTEGSLWREYLRDFKSNFRQSTAIWLLGLAGLAMLWVDLRIFAGIAELAFLLQVITYAAAIMLCLTLLYALALQARFINPVRATLKNALLLWASMPHYAFAIGGVTALPLVLAGWIPMTLGIFLLVGVSGSGWICGIWFRRVFARVRVNPEQIPESSGSTGARGDD